MKSKEEILKTRLEDVGFYCPECDQMSRLELFPVRENGLFWFEVYCAKCEAHICNLGEPDEA